ncbi:Uncharacterised protein [Anaerotruncus sp. 2789STDY5834896]|uniref:Uncharacterized protein n=1 Tax=uncultured Anaerotruncus sp. TaxID=905011 RepID=A0A1C6G116_9FIRM|nr:Uncharacterised protein [uncultured Anaerotruncus sp.]
MSYREVKELTTEQIIKMYTATYGETPKGKSLEIFKLCVDCITAAYDEGFTDGLKAAAEREDKGEDEQ